MQGFAASLKSTENPALPQPDPLLPVMNNKAPVKSHQTLLQQLVLLLSRKNPPVSLIQLNPTMRYSCSNDCHQLRQDPSPLVPFKSQFSFHLPTSIRAMDQPRGQNCLKQPSADGGKEHNTEQSFWRGLQASQLTTSPTTGAPGVIFIIFLMRSDMLCIHSHSG